MRLLLLVSLLFLSSCAKEVEAKPTISKATKMSFEEVWDVLLHDKYKTLPHYTLSAKALRVDNRDIILHDAKRTLESRADILPPFDKLAHPNGICFKGIWRIDQANIYSGYFQKGTVAPIIARISTALSNTSSQQGTRAFGFAGKLFGKNPKEPTANFFLVDDLGGRDLASFSEVVLLNEPPLSITYEVAQHLLYATKVASTFEKVDAHAKIRQLYEVSQLDTKSSQIITPKWMKLEVSQMPNKPMPEFRDELEIYTNQKLVLDISVANKMVENKKNWQKIGTITLDDSLLSLACDKRLHFHHPRWRDDLNYGE
ncbi:MAG: hypothetical protein JXQ76_03825 [Campylobacterales bacterium]|nr:hypothetical protein [Campylobacterales bacterium]